MKSRFQRAAYSTEIGSLARWICIAVAVLAVVVITSGCGSSGGDSASGESLEHIHGLGINPKDQALIVATHTGLFRVAPDSDQIDRIGESDQDTMGFSVVGPDQFLGSGHPGAFSSGVNPLGLIRSSDGGSTWTSISLEGEADFHSLRASGQRIYGINGGQLLVSANGGQTWEERRTPVALFDVAISPKDVDHILAAGEDGLYASTDGGRSWRPNNKMIGLLSWASDDHLYLVDGEGSTHVSDDAGKSWTNAGTIGGQPAALYAAGEGAVYAAVGSGTIMQSVDGGKTWTTRAQP